MYCGAEIPAPKYPVAPSAKKAYAGSDNWAVRALSASALKLMPLVPASLTITSLPVMLNTGFVVAALPAVNSNIGAAKSLCVASIEIAVPVLAPGEAPVAWIT